jgi:phage/plasmid-like protein (TIGR03299 family)
MPHELDRLDDGTGAMFSVRDTPWHREGTVLTEAPTLSRALELGGLEFDVEVRPLYTRTQPSPGVPVFDYKRAGNACATVRTDRNDVLGIVSERYQPLQNRDAFGVLEPLLDAGLASLETGGSLRSGRDVWMLVRFHVHSPVVQEVFADEVIPFGLISNNHAGQRRVVVQETPIRVVCANTLSLAQEGKGRALSVRHTASVEAKTVEAAQQLWSGLIERYETAARQYRALKAFHLDTDLFRRLVLDVAAPMPSRLERPDLTPRQEGARARILARRGRLTQLWTEGAGHRGDHSGWEALNGTVQTLDHDADLWRVRGPRTAALLDGRLADVKQRVLATLVAATTSSRN